MRLTLPSLYFSHAYAGSLLAQPAVVILKLPPETPSQQAILCWTVFST